MRRRTQALHALGAVCVLALATAAQAQGNGAKLTAAQHARVDSLVSAYRAEHTVTGVSYAIAQGDRLLVASGAGLADAEVSAPANAETVFRIGSVTKQFTAALVLRLLEQGKLSLDDEITKYFPDFPTQGHRVTVHHLLNHTSGIKSYTGLDPQHIQTIWRQTLTNDQVVALFKDTPFDFAPGEKYAYNNSAYFLLGMLIERVTGEPYASHLTKTLLAPLGLTRTSYCDQRAIVPNRASGYRRVNGEVANALPIDMTIPGAAGAMCSNVLDLVRWTRMLHTGEVLAPTSYVAMTSTVQLGNGTRSAYGYGLGIGALDGQQAIAHSGGINGFVVQQLYLPAREITVIVLTNAEGGPLGALTNNLARVALGTAPQAGGTR